MREETPHPTQKAKALIHRLVFASSFNRGGSIINPFSASETTLVSAGQLGRRWLGCDINLDYHQWAIQRIEAVELRSDETWF